MSRRGEEFDRFVQDQAAPLHRLAYMMCGDWHLADDLVQEAFVKCFNHWGRVQRSDNPAAYVRRILINESNRHWRRHRQHTPTGGTTGPEASTADDSTPVTERAALLQALMSLPPGQRAVVILRHLEDLSEHETARLLGCSEGTVKSQNARALKTLKINFEQQEICQ